MHEKCLFKTPKIQTKKETDQANGRIWSRTTKAPTSKPPKQREQSNVQIVCQASEVMVRSLS